MSKILIYLLVAFFVIIFLELDYLISQQLSAASAECEARYNMPCTILNAFRNSG